MESLEQLGSQAYQKGLWGDYKGAIDILSKAIARFPSEKRLYNNRCCYYMKLKDYKSAFSDAEKMLCLDPTSTRGHFRKGEILMDLEMYAEAEQVFRDLLNLHPVNKEAKFNLLEAQVCQLTEGGNFWMIDAKKALELNEFDTVQAKAFLAVGGLDDVNKYNLDDIYYSDEEVDKPSAVVAKPASSVLNPKPAIDPYTDPENPFKSNALWVGNITAKITRENLESVFSKYGKIKSIVIQHQNHCAFVNYAHSSMASAAMRAFPQKFHLEDTFLVIRFPSNAKAKNAANFATSKNKGS